MQGRQLAGGAACRMMEGAGGGRGLYARGRMRAPRDTTGWRTQATYLGGARRLGIKSWDAHPPRPPG